MNVEIKEYCGTEFYCVDYDFFVDEVQADTEGYYWHKQLEKYVKEVFHCNGYL